MRTNRTLAVLGAVATIATTGVVGAAPADAYLFTRNGYTYADTEYPGNVSGSYVKTVSRYDAKQGVLYVKGSGRDTVCDTQRAAALLHGWSNAKRTWVYYKSGAVPTGCHQGWITATTAIPVRRLGISAVTLQDGIYGKTYGRNWVRIWHS
jgi:hypothetical protein